MRRIFVSLMAAAILIGMMNTTVFAHGGHGRGGHGRGHHQTVQKQTGYVPCTVDGCEIAHSHQHDENWYCGQTGLAGEYAVCTVTGCTAIGLHEHDGQYYHCQNYGTGSERAIAANNYAICSVSGCTAAGVHEHDGTYYRCQTPPAESGRGRNCHRR